MLKVEAPRLHYASGQKQTTRVVDAGDDGPLDRDACVRLSAGDAADGATCLLSQHGTDLRPIRDECRWLVLPGPSAESGDHSRAFVSFRTCTAACVRIASGSFAPAGHEKHPLRTWFRTTSVDPLLR